MEKSTYTPGRLIARPSAVCTPLSPASLNQKSKRREEKVRLSDIRGEICRDDALLGYVKKGGGEKVMDRRARLEV